MTADALESHIMDVLENAERRARERQELSILGRYMLPDRREFPCQVRNISASGMLMVCAEPGDIGDRIIAYIDNVGRLEGVIRRVEDTMAAVEFTVPETKQSKIAEAIDWLKEHHQAGTPEGRKHPRTAPEITQSRFALPDGRSYPCEVIDMSMSGASVKVEVVPALGTPVTLGKMRGKVVRIHDRGVAIEFTDVQDTSTLADHFG